jgi:hypothetical protein
MPSHEIASEPLVQNPNSDVQRLIRTSGRPPHLLPLDQPFADHLVDGRFHKSGRDQLAMSATIRVVRNRVQVGFEVVRELTEFGFLVTFAPKVLVRADIRGARGLRDHRP